MELQKFTFHCGYGAQGSVTSSSPFIEEESIVAEVIAFDRYHLVSKRDRWCLMSGYPEHATLTHILARSWYQNTEDRKDMLPENVRIVIETVGIDSPANGMLLQEVMLRILMKEIRSTTCL